MDFYSAYAFNGKAVNEKRSFLSLGEAQLDPLLSIWDDATDPRHMGRVFDSEGTPKRHTPLVERGVVTCVCHDRRTAAAAGGGASTTGHAVPGGRGGGRLCQQPVPRCQHRSQPAARRPRGSGKARIARERLLVHQGPRPKDPGRHRSYPQRRLSHRKRGGRGGRWPISGSRNRTLQRSHPAMCWESGPTPNLPRRREGHTSAVLTCPACTWPTGTSPAMPPSSRL